MPIPDYQKVMLPLLNALSDGKEHSNKDIKILLAEDFQLSKQEVEQRLPKGGNKLLNRIDWAKQYFKHAGLIEYPGGTRSYKLTKRGLDVWATKPKIVNNEFLKQFPEFLEYLDASKNKKSKKGKINPVDIFPDEAILTHQNIFEGKQKEIKLNIYERDPRGKKICLRHHGTSCLICGFNFAKNYGALGKEYIHIHHLLPLSLIRDEYKLDPINDLIPVCPNCHAMIHKKHPPYTVEEIRSRLKG